MSEQVYTFIFYCGGEEEVFLRRFEFSSDDEAIREAEAALRRQRALKPAVVTEIAVGRGYSDVDEGQRETDWFGSWAWDGTGLRWVPESP